MFVPVISKKLRVKKSTLNGVMGYNFSDLRLIYNLTASITKAQANAPVMA
jgi:hypothetical protein